MLYDITLDKMELAKLHLIAEITTQTIEEHKGESTQEILELGEFAKSLFLYTKKFI